MQPSFDGRIVLYPTTHHLRDYLSWRQADVHINNLYNTVFWSMVKSGISRRDAENRLKGTLAADKNEILFSEFGINYNNEDEMFRKGSVIIKDLTEEDPNSTLPNTEDLDSVARAEHSLPFEKSRRRQKRESEPANLLVLHEDIIRSAFWEKHPEILGPLDGKPPRIGR